MGTSEETVNLIAHAVSLLKSPPVNLLSEGERAEGYEVLGMYIDEDITPVPPHSFVRQWWIVRRSFGLSNLHTSMKNQLANLIAKHLAALKPPYSLYRVNPEFRLNTAIKSKARDEVLPDVAVYPFPLQGIIATSPPGVIPLLVVEVLSESTSEKDREVKREKYQRLGVRHYWMLSQSEDPIQGLNASTFLELQSGTYIDVSTQFHSAKRLQCADAGDLDLDPEDVWVLYSDRTVAKQWLKESQRADAERQRADAERQRANAAEAELNRLKKITSGKGA